MKNNAKLAGWKEWAFCLAAAAAILMLCSMNSWLYPLNPWVDVNCFVTVAREMLEGAMPYRDLMEQKGPLLYAMHVLALLISPRSYHGIYLLEVLSLSGVMFLFLRIARLYVPKLNAGWAAVLAAGICVTTAFQFGDSAEEFCLLPIAFSMYSLLKSWKENRPLSGRQYFLNGVAAGCIFWIKFNLLGFHLVWMGFQAIEALVRDRSLRRPVRMCLWFLGGMAVTALPWLIYFGANGALVDILDVYLYRNAFHYRTNDRLRQRIFKAMTMTLEDWRLCVMLLTAALGITVFGRGRISWKERFFILFVAGIVFLSVYCMGQFAPYYPLTLALFLPFALIPVGILCERKDNGSLRKTTAVQAVLFVLSLCIAMTGNNFQYVGFDYEDTIQGQAVRLTEGMEDPLMLNVNELDVGLYMALDARPADRWFVRLNYDRPACWEAQRKCIEQGIPDLVACVKWPMEEMGINGDYSLLDVLVTEYLNWGKVYLYRKNP